MKDLHGLMRYAVETYGERAVVEELADHFAMRCARAYRRRGENYVAWQKAERLVARLRDAMQGADIGGH